MVSGTSVTGGTEVQERVTGCPGSRPLRDSESVTRFTARWTPYGSLLSPWSNTGRALSLTTGQRGGATLPGGFPSAAPDVSAIAADS